MVHPSATQRSLPAVAARVGVSSRQRKKMGGRGTAGRRHVEPQGKPATIVVPCKEYKDK